MRWLWTISAFALLAAANVRAAQPPAKEPARLAKEPAPLAKVESEPPTAQQIQTWIGELDSDRYQVREDATAGLLRGGYDAVGPLADAAEKGGLEVAIRAIFVLRETALSDDARTATAAEQALQKLSQTQGVAAPRAATTLVSLAELRRRRIRKYLADLGAKFQSTQRFLGGVDPFPDYYGLWLDQDWKGTDADLVKLKSLTNITSVSLDGPRVNDGWLKQIADMPSLTSVSVKRAKITSAGIAELKRIANLRELNVYYSPVGDGAIDSLTSLDGLTVLKLFGGGFTTEGEGALRAAFDQSATLLDIRKGAFLGVSCNALPSGCMVSYVREGSAAEKAGLQNGDIIVSYDGKKVDDFEGLTALIAQHGPGETSEMEILRNSSVLKKKVTLGEWE